ncbi:MAG: lipopolysaccharide assembly protein LapA domain-containing protein [Micropepsaceae bacterium]
MTSLFRTVFFWTLALATAAIAVANRKGVTLSFDPFNTLSPAVAVEVRLFWIILGAALIGIVLGSWSSWLAQAPLRRTLREQEERIRRLEREVESAQSIIAKPSPSTAPRIGRS